MRALKCKSLIRTPIQRSYVARGLPKKLVAFLPLVLEGLDNQDYRAMGCVVFYVPYP
jgi:hypothetical protein